jgi:hypothetical protein
VGELEAHAHEQDSPKPLLILFDQRWLGPDPGDPKEPLLALVDGLAKRGVPFHLSFELLNVSFAPRDPETWEELAERLPKEVDRYIAGLVSSAVAHGTAPADAAHLADFCFRRAVLKRSGGYAYGRDLARAVTALATGRFRVTLRDPAGETAVRDVDGLPSARDLACEHGWTIAQRMPGVRLAMGWEADGRIKFGLETDGLEGLETVAILEEVKP